MTREEAIDVLKQFRKVIGLNDDLKRALDKRDIPLLDMAIEALKADAEQTELPQYEEWQDLFDKMCESAKPKTFVADEWYRNTFKDGDVE